MSTSHDGRELSGSATFLLALLLTANAGSAAEGGSGLPSLSVPSKPGVLSIGTRVPAGTSSDLSGRWHLVEQDGGAPIAAELVPAQELDGTASATDRALVAVIPPRPGAPPTRQFKLVAAAPSVAEGKQPFRFEAVTDKSLGLWEGTRPVFVYKHGVMSKAGVPDDRNRSTYLHPVYGLDGEVLTDDFPKDHYHHRGLFWAWPHVRIDGRDYSLWDIRGIHQRFERWIARQAGSNAACLAVENGWYAGERKVVQERVWFTIYPTSGDGRLMDIDLIWIPTQSPVTLEGAEDKSYGGLTLRFAPRTNTVITTPLGNRPDDLAVTRLEWADLSAQFASASQPSGAAIFISPDHPDFPPQWLTRHYGVLCVGWPGVNPGTLQPGVPVRASYRLWIHRKATTAPEAKLAYEAYQAGRQVRWGVQSNQ